MGLQKIKQSNFRFAPMNLKYAARLAQNLRKLFAHIFAKFIEKQGSCTPYR